MLKWPFILTLLCFSQRPWAQPISLKNAIDILKNKNFEVKTFDYQSPIAATDLTLIHGETSPKINFLAGVGPINKKEGDINHYVDQKAWGAEWIGSIEAKVPLYLWGREKDLQKASSLNVELTKTDKKKKINESILKLKEAYYGEQFALSLLDFVNETLNDLNSAIKAINEKKGKKEDGLRLEVFKYQVEEKKIEIKKNIDLARMAIRFYLGNSISEDFENERLWIEKDERELASLETYLQVFKSEYPDVQKVEMGIEAKEALLKNEKKNDYPVVGALLKYDFAKTNERTPLNNPFLYDRYNHHELSVGIGLTLDIDFGVKQSKKDKLVLEIAELNAKKNFAHEGLGLLVKKAYMEVNEKEARLQKLNLAYKSAKKWLSNVQTSVGLGLSPAKDIIDAYTTRAFVYKDYYESIYNYQMAWAKLSDAVGTEVDPLLK